MLCQIPPMAVLSRLPLPCLLAALVASLAGAEPVPQPKVVVVTMFVVGADTGDTPGGTDQ